MSACSSLRDMSTTKRTTWTTLAGFKLVGVENAVRPVSECTLSDRRLNTRHCFASEVFFFSSLLCEVYNADHPRNAYSSTDGPVLQISSNIIHAPLPRDTAQNAFVSYWCKWEIDLC